MASSMAYISKQVARIGAPYVFFDILWLLWQVSYNGKQRQKNFRILIFPHFFCHIAAILWQGSYNGKQVVNILALYFHSGNLEFGIFVFHHFFCHIVAK